MVRRDLIGIEEQLLERYPELAAHHAVARRAGAQEITAVIGRFDAAGETDAEAFVARLPALREELHDYRPLVRSVAKRGKRTSLGAARLSALTLPGNPEVKVRMKKRARTR